jgi:uracil-DNA glycosylase
MTDDIAALIDQIARCTHCAAYLPLGPRPVVQLGATADILIIGQAPGTKVHASGVPWQDDSGDRLRAWMGIEQVDFYDPAKVALMPMGFCYPGKGKSGDAPPRPECAPLWHDRVLALLPPDRLTLLVGNYAQQHYLPRDAGVTLAERVRGFRRYAPSVFPLPHSSWRVVGWQRRNPWFEAELLPELRAAVRARLDRRG